MPVPDAADQHRTQFSRFLLPLSALCRLSSMHKLSPNHRPTTPTTVSSPLNVIKRPTTADTPASRTTRCIVHVLRMCVLFEVFNYPVHQKRQNTSHGHHHRNHGKLSATQPRERATFHAECTRTLRVWSSIGRICHMQALYIF